VAQIEPRHEVVPSRCLPAFARHVAILPLMVNRRAASPGQRATAA
jgi:hypothetical protein